MNYLAARRYLESMKFGILKKDGDLYESNPYTSESFYVHDCNNEDEVNSLMRVTIPEAVYAVICDGDLFVMDKGTL